MHAGCLRRCHYNAGFVLQAGGGITCIDLDVVNAETQAAKGKPVDATQWSTQADLDRYWQIMNYFDSYTERSRSGFGLHIWVAGEIGAGCRRGHIEVYSQERYIICTGNVIVNKPIAHKQDILNAMVGDMRAVQQQDRAVELIEVSETLSDEKIWERASNADNDQKFKQLCEGNWQALGYPSQSEADLALMSMFTFYSDSNEQCRRMFRQTALGQRAKATRDNRYLDHTLRLIRGRQEIDKEIEAQAVELRKTLGAKLNDIMLNTLQAQQQRQAQAMTTVAPSKQSTLSELSPLVQVDGCEMPWPPGNAGIIAQFLYYDSYLPIREVAIIGTLGLLAGICGRAYTTPTGKDLGLYLILVGKSGIGKDAIHEGVPKLIQVTSIPQAQYFIRVTDFASGPALHKELLMHPGFLWLQGEFGRKLKSIAMPTNMPMQELRTVMTNAYSKESLEGKSYSDATHSLESVKWPALSFLGETTPETFTAAMTPDMMEDGFMSRFLIMSYQGDRPPTNKVAGKAALAIMKDLKFLINTAIPFQGPSCHVVRTCVNFASSEVENIFNNFDSLCRDKINATESNYLRQSWNRAHLKALKVAGLLACIDNPKAPCIEQTHAQWAIDLIDRDIKYFQKQYHSGNVGNDDHARESKIKHLCEKYLREEPASSYKIPTHLWKAHIVPRTYFQKQVSQTAAFTNHRNGSTSALDNALKSLVVDGCLEEKDKQSIKQEYDFNGKCYKINVKAFL